LIGVGPNVDENLQRYDYPVKRGIPERIEWARPVKKLCGLMIGAVSHPKHTSTSVFNPFAQYRTVHPMKNNQLDTKFCFP
jgi:hypothetical protein